MGAGFDPELTGRQNIFLKGASLGTDRTEIRSKFSETVAFAEVERFRQTSGTAEDVKLCWKRGA